MLKLTTLSSSKYNKEKLLGVQEAANLSALNSLTSIHPDLALSQRGGRYGSGKLVS